MVVPNGYIQEHISLVHLGSNKFTRKRTDVAKSNLDLCHSVLNMFNFRISSLTSVSSPSLTDSVPISDLRLSQSSHADEEPDPFFSFAQQLLRCWHNNLFKCALQVALEFASLAHQTLCQRQLGRQNPKLRIQLESCHSASNWGTMGQIKLTYFHVARTDWLALNNGDSTAKSDCASFRTERGKIDPTIPAVGI